MGHFSLKSVIAACALILCTAAAGAEFRVGLVLDKGGKDDKSFNAAAFKGASQAEKDLKIKIKTIEATDDNAFEPTLRSLAEKKFDLIICIGFSQADAVRKVSQKYPDRHFVIVDSDVPGPNVKSVMFEEHEGSFLMGAIAALKSKTGRVGFVGGMDVPLIRRFEMGYKAGAEAAVPKIKVSSSFVGVTPDAWNNPPKAKELALAQYNVGADVIFHAAGASGAGVFDAAEQKKLLAIGVDSNQNWVKPGFILTSMLKRVDLAVLNAIKESKDGKFVAGTTRSGLKDGGVDYALDSFNEKLLTPDILARVDGMKKDIIAGKVKVPDYYISAAKK